MKWFKIWLVLPCILTLPACFMARGYLDRPIDWSRVPQIQRGITTKQEVLDMFGPPQAIDGREVVAVGDLLGLPGNNRRVEQLVSARYFRYSYQRANGWIVLTGVFNYFDADVKGDTLVVFFDGDDIVEDYAFAEDTRLLPRFGPFSRATEEDSAEARIDTSAGRAERAAEQAAAAAERTSEAAARAEHAADRVESIRASD
jgi:hypothetical protein